MTNTEEQLVAIVAKCAGVNSLSISVNILKAKCCILLLIVFFTEKLPSLI